MVAARQALLIAYLAVEATIVTGTLLFAHGHSIQRASLSVGFLMVAGWWIAPATIVTLHRTPTAVTATGAAMLGASAWALWSMYTSSHSTAAIGFLVWPVLRAVGVTGSLAVAAGAAPLRRRR